MIQLRYSTGNPTSAIFGFKLGISDGEEFSFSLDHEAGEAKAPSHFIWLTKQIAKSNTSDNYFLSKGGKDTIYQKKYKSFFKASKRFNFDSIVKYNKKRSVNKLSVNNNMFSAFFNYDVNKINIFDDILSTERVIGNLGVNLDFIGAITPSCYLDVRNEYIKLFRPLGNLNVENTNHKLSKDYMSSGLSCDDLSLLRDYSDLSNEYFSRQLSNGGSTLDVDKEFIMAPQNSKTLGISSINTSLSKLSLDSSIVEAYLKLSLNNFNVYYNDNKFIKDGSLGAKLVEDCIGFDVFNGKLYIDYNLGADMFHKELYKYNIYKSFIRQDSNLKDFTTSISLSSSSSNASITDIKFAKFKNKYLSRQYQDINFNKKNESLIKFGLENNLKGIPIEFEYLNNSVFASRDNLYTDMLNTEKTLVFDGDNITINDGLNTLYRGDSELKISDKYKLLHYGQKDVTVKFNDIQLNSSTRSLLENNSPLTLSVSEKKSFIDNYSMALDRDGNYTSIKSTDINFSIDGEEAIIGSTILGFDRVSSEISYDNEVSKWLDSNSETLGIFNSGWLSNSSDNLSIENYLIMGYNHNKMLDKDSFKSLGFNKNGFEFLIPEEMRLELGKSSIVIPDNMFGHVNDFLPPIEILKKASDELLLPKEGFDYSSYRNEMFGVNLTINPKYIKRLTEEGNPIINVPIENPVRYYTDIARDYINVDVTIMRKVLELLYRNWRKNIHRHAGLEPTKAINNILELTHKDLLEFYTSTTDRDRLKHAERSLKLFAWYCEMGILSHSDKEVVYKRSNGVFDFWGELPHYGVDDKVVYRGISKEEITEFTNFVYNNENKFILSTLPGQNASMTISDMPQVINTRLNFKAYILGKGILRVSVDSKIYTYNERINIVDIPLPSEGNKIQIKFFPSNEASSLDIAEFVIRDRYNDSYELVYTGKVKNMNFTLQYVLDFMSITGDSIEEVQPVLKSTAQLAYALDKFKEYMETHHDNKFKGKRLTVRK